LKILRKATFDEVSNSIEKSTLYNVNLGDEDLIMHEFDAKTAAIFD